MTPAAPLVAARQVVKNYQALRPLRIEDLAVTAGEIVSLVGLDAPGAEMLVGLLTGAIVPDSGEVRLFGRSTSEVADSDAWLAMLDGVGILTDRAVLIGQFTIEQNIAMPFTLTVDPIASDVQPAVEALARELGLEGNALKSPVATSSASAQALVRLGRALALKPKLLLAEHPSASLPRDQVKEFAATINRIARARALAVLAITADEMFAEALGGQYLRLDPATGALRPRRSWSKLFNRS
jgi:ABC-type lipoprotein export system ATPase subunit